MPPVKVRPVVAKSQHNQVRFTGHFIDVLVVFRTYGVFCQIQLPGISGTQSKDVDYIQRTIAPVNCVPDTSRYSRIVFCLIGGAGVKQNKSGFRSVGVPATPQ